MSPNVAMDVDEQQQQQQQQDLGLAAMAALSLHHKEDDGGGTTTTTASTSTALLSATSTGEESSSFGYGNTAAAAAHSQMMMMALPPQPTLHHHPTAPSLGRLPQETTLDGTYQVDYSPRHAYGNTAGHTWVRPAVHRRTGQRVAIKSIRQFRRAEVQALRKEATILQQLQPHPCIVAFHGVYEDTAHYHLVMEACLGGEVYDLVAHATERSKVVQEKAAARIMEQVLHAVVHCHNCDIVHRDIKLENILFVYPAKRQHVRDTTKSTEIRLVDFGLATRHGPNDPPLTEHVGSPYYVAPEVLRRSYNRACDVWSLGAVAYALLSGQPPFDGETATDMFTQICHAPLQFEHAAWNMLISAEARRFVATCLQKDPYARPTAAELLQHEWILNHSIDNDNMSIQSGGSAGSSKGGGRRNLLRALFRRG